MIWLFRSSTKVRALWSRVVRRIKAVQSEGHFNRHVSPRNTRRNKLREQCLSHHDLHHKMMTFGLCLRGKLAMQTQRSCDKSTEASKNVLQAPTNLVVSFTQSQNMAVSSSEAYPRNVLSVDSPAAWQHCFQSWPSLLLQKRRRLALVCRTFETHMRTDLELVLECRRRCPGSLSVSMVLNAHAGQGALCNDGYIRQ